MEAKDYLAYISDVIHRSIVATVDAENLPVTSAIDMMDSDEHGLYFLTAKGKGFYHRLKARQYMALTAMQGDDTMHSVAVSVRGKVRELGAELLPRLFVKNPYMSEIYPTEESRTALTVFQLYEGTGEWFDLSKKPIERAAFAFGEAKYRQEGYFISESCIRCGSCLTKCPQQCIDLSGTKASIRQENCLHCGNCLRCCPVGAVEKRG